MIYEATCLETLQQSQCGQQDLPVSATRWVLLKSHNGNCQHRQSHYIFYQGNFTFSHYTTSFHGRFVTFSIIYLFFFFGDVFGCPASLLFFLQRHLCWQHRGTMYYIDQFFSYHCSLFPQHGIITLMELLHNPKIYKRRRSR